MSIGLKFDYEPQIGQRRPDYLLHPPACDVLCEVEEFGEGPVDRQLREQLKTKGTAVTSLNPYSRIREKLEAAAAQLREFKDRYPCVVVLYNPGYMVDLGTDIVQGAMYGDIAVVFRVHSMGEHDPVKMGVQFTPKKAKLRHNQNTTLSAVAILERIKPNQRIIEKALELHWQGSAEKTLPSKNQIAERLEFVDSVRKQYPGVDFDLVVPRLRIIHNFYAVVPLPRTVFNGPHDQQFVLREGEKHFELLSTS